MRGQKNKNDNLIGFIIVGAVLFGIGRCSADDGKPSRDKEVAATFASSENAGNALIEENASELNTAEPALTTVPEPAALVSTDTLDDLADEGEGLSCGSKRYCREMNSCAEAYHYLNECGLGRLDGDGDGVPCETIC